MLAEDVIADALADATERWPQVSAADNVHAYVRKMIVNQYLGVVDRPVSGPVLLDLAVAEGTAGTVPLVQRP